MTIALLVAVVGLVLYLAAPDKVAEVGRIAFFTGLLVTLLKVGSAAL